MQKKVRIIVGPNGSGKSTIKLLLSKKYHVDFGFFINADEIEREINQSHILPNELNLSHDETIDFLKKHTLNKIFSLKKLFANIKVNPKNIMFINHKVTSYEAAALADLFRNRALQLKIKFSFETVFSDISKVGFIKKLNKNGYKIYLYVIATLNPEINKNRVKNRVKNHGHSVPEDKIVTRYYKSLSNISKAIPFSHRCFIIDNSQDYSPILISEVTNGRKVNYLNHEFQPDWVKKLLKNLFC